MASPYKKTKRNLSDTRSESEDEDISRFLRFIVLESQDDSPLVNLSSFVIDKVISVNLKPKTDKKKTEKWKPPSRGRKKKKHADFLMKMKIFHTRNIIAYPH